MKTERNQVGFARFFVFVIQIGNCWLFPYYGKNVFPLGG